MIGLFARKMIMWAVIILTYAFLVSYRVPLVELHSSLG